MSHLEPPRPAVGDHVPFGRLSAGHEQNLFDDRQKLPLLQFLLEDRSQDTAGLLERFDPRQLAAISGDDRHRAQRCRYRESPEDFDLVMDGAGGIDEPQLPVRLSLESPGVRETFGCGFRGH